MISKLKRKFTILATVSVFLLMTVLVLIMNIVNYTSVVSESDTVLSVLSQPNAPFGNGQDIPVKPPQDIGDFIPRGMSPEVPYESRYFTVIVTPDGEIKEPNFTKIISVDETSANEYIEKALKSHKENGFIGQFRFMKVSDERFTRILFLDCGRKLDSFRTFMWTSIAVGLLGCFLVFVGFIFVSGKIVKPIADSYEKQKRFISDAGHEIKTPLTIIGANVDLLEADGEKEELSDIREQVARLTDLTNNLVSLSKMEEMAHSIPKIDFPLSDLIADTAGLFHSLLSSKNILFRADIFPDLTLYGSPDSIRQLVSILLENAVKYAPEGGTVSLHLVPCKKTVSLSVFNTTGEKVLSDDLKYVFDRFYRTDTSRNSGTGGHGIGLSIAKAIAETHGGTIQASTKSGYDFTITVTLPH